MQNALDDSFNYFILLDFVHKTLKPTTSLMHFIKIYDVSLNSSNDASPPPKCPGTGILYRVDE